MNPDNAHFLLPCELFATREPYRVRTILGSCVAVCLYDTILMQGGINHFMLPRWHCREIASPKFGNIAIMQLVEKMISLGSQPSHLVARLYGGADQHGFDKTGIGAGKSNIEEAEKVLRQFGITVIERHIGGFNGRKITFDTKTGEAAIEIIAPKNSCQ